MCQALYAVFPGISLHCHNYKVNINIISISQMNKPSPTEIEPKQSPFGISIAEIEPKQSPFGVSIASP